MSCRRPSNTSSSGTGPCSPVTGIVASTSTIGSRRRAAAMASPSRVCAFSRTSSSSSWACQVARSTTEGSAAVSRSVANGFWLCVLIDVSFFLLPLSFSARGSGALPQLVAAASQVGDLGGVARQLDGFVVRSARLLTAAQPAQQVGAGRMVGMIAGQRVLKTVNGHQRHLGAVKLGDRNSPIEGDDRRRVEADELVVE